MDSTAFLLAADLPTPPDWRLLGEHLPYDWIEAALSNSGSATIRRRRLPAEQVVSLVIAMSLYRHRSIRQVVAELDLALPDSDDTCVTDSAVTQARQRLGEDPLAWLFRESARNWRLQDAERYHFKGLHLLAMDGTTLKLADSAANRAHFDSPSFANDGVASYPHARMVILSVLRTQLVLSAEFGSYAYGEMTYAKLLLGDIPDRSLTVFDSGFLSADFFTTLCADGIDRHFLIPSRVNSKLKLIEGDENDGIVEMKISSEARKKNPALPAHWRVRAVRSIERNGKPTYLLTSLMDKATYPAKSLQECYQERWHIETSYREMKQSMMGMALSLRSHSVDATRQEIWGMLIAYNLVRLEMARAAEQAACLPTDISFVLALHTFQFEMMHAAALQAQGNLPGVLKRMRERMIIELNVYRPDRKFDRVAKAKPQRYPERRLRRTLT